MAATATPPNRRNIPLDVTDCAYPRHRGRGHGPLLRRKGNRAHVSGIRSLDAEQRNPGCCHASQQFLLLAGGEPIVLVPRRSLDDMRRRLRGRGTTDVRERQDRL